MSVIELNNNNFQKEALESKIPVLIDFWASWCGPCKMLTPVIHEVAAENSDFKVCKVNVDEERELATSFEVMSIPTLIVIKNGKVVNRSVGFKQKRDILNLIK